ncbi:Nicotinate phosphoribosyltransferase OS=Streptomyces tendae OX=1932 GN=GUR47_07835 PE=3 SV=1 [Streptomyces tendae]
MLRALRSKAGTAGRRSVFEVFTRRLPDGRRYGVVAGTGRVLDAVENFRFDAGVLRFLRERGIVDEETLDWLAEYRFRGDIWGYPEGEVYFPGSPIMRVEGTFGECVLLETVILSILNHDSAIAAAASRMSSAAGDRPLIEMGARRTHELAAVAQPPARPTWAASRPPPTWPPASATTSRPSAPPPTPSPCCTTTSATPSAPRWTPWAGTPRCWSTPTTSPRPSVRPSRSPGPSWARCASTPATCCWSPTGCASSSTSWAATETKIVVTSDLDEYAIASLAAAPVDAYGVGTQLVTGSGHPTASMVYKLVARAESGEEGAPLVPVAKKSTAAARRRSAAASGPRGAWTRTGRRGRGGRHRAGAGRAGRPGSSW